jgi:hypothetical protein
MGQWKYITYIVVKYNMYILKWGRDGSKHTLALLYVYFRNNPDDEYTLAEKCKLLDVINQSCVWTEIAIYFISGYTVTSLI